MIREHGLRSAVRALDSDACHSASVAVGLPDTWRRRGSGPRRDPFTLEPTVAEARRKCGERSAGVIRVSLNLKDRVEVRLVADVQTSCLRAVDQRCQIDAEELPVVSR